MTAGLNRTAEALADSMDFALHGTAMAV